MAVLIPALDEEEALPAALSALPPGLADRVVVVDNGSRDATAQVAKAAGAEVVAEPRRGYGRACLAGIRQLRIHDPPEVILFLDADHRHSAADLRAVTAPAAADRADLVLGVRRPPPGARAGSAGGGPGEGGPRRVRPPHARWGTAAVLLLARIVHGVRHRDLPPLRAIRTDALERLEMDDPDFGWTLQMQIRAHRRGLRTLEVEVEHRDRAVGDSKISGSLAASLRAGVRMGGVILRELRTAPEGGR